MYLTRRAPSTLRLTARGTESCAGRRRAAKPRQLINIWDQIRALIYASVEESGYSENDIDLVGVLIGFIFLVCWVRHGLLLLILLLYHLQSCLHVLLQDSNRYFHIDGWRQFSWRGGWWGGQYLSPPALGHWHVEIVPSVGRYVAKWKMILPMVGGGLEGEPSGRLFVQTHVYIHMAALCRWLIWPVVQLTRLCDIWRVLD